MRLNSLERQVLGDWRDGLAPRLTQPVDDEQWLRVVLHFALQTSRLVRCDRLGDLDGSVRLKADRSPVTDLEHRIEQLIADGLRHLPEPVAFVSEESISEALGPGITLAVDPVDGTWALVNRTEHAATSLALLRDGVPFIGVVANPATGEIAYTVDGQVPRLVQLGAFGEADRAVSLPIPRAGPEGLLVSVHPNRALGDVGVALATAWRNREVDMVRSPGGAPTLELLGVAKGNFAYVNLWNRRRSAPWDLAAGLMLVRAAGGDVVDLDGAPIRAIGHRGPFVGSLLAVDRERVRSLVRPSLQPVGG